MKLFCTALLALLVFSEFSGTFSVAQGHSAAPSAVPKIPPSGSSLALRASSTMNVPSEMGGAFMSSSKCDADGNLYIRKLAVDRPLLGPVVKIDPDGKRTALFDPAAFSQLSGLKRDLQNRNDRGRNFTAVFSADGRELAQLSFPEAQGAAEAGTKSGGGAHQNAAQKDAQRDAQKDAEKSAPTLDLADAEAGSDGNLYVMRHSSPALVYVIASSGKVMQTIKVASPLLGAVPSGFHLSGNRLAISFWNDGKHSQTIVVADAQTGRKIASYADATGLGPSFACYSANDGVFTFLRLGEGNELEVIRAEAQ